MFVDALRRLARIHGRLPESMMITGKIEPPDNILTSGEFAEVRTGTYMGTLVAVKALRVDEREGCVKLRKVSIYRCFSTIRARF